MWINIVEKATISAEERIKEIEEGVIPVRTRLLENRVEIIKQLKHFVAVVGLVHLVFSSLSYSIILENINQSNSPGVSSTNTQIAILMSTTFHQYRQLKRLILGN